MSATQTGDNPAPDQSNGRTRSPPPQKRTRRTKAQILADAKKAAGTKKAKAPARKAASETTQPLPPAPPMATAARRAMPPARTAAPPANGSSTPPELISATFKKVPAAGATWTAEGATQFLQTLAQNIMFEYGLTGSITVAAKAA